MNMENSEASVNFIFFVSGLMAEGFVALGLIENPATKKVEKNLQHAGIVIDTLNMLKEKTKGNLTKEESDSIEEAIHQLRMVYVAGTKDTASKIVKP